MEIYNAWFNFQINKMNNKKLQSPELTSKLRNFEEPESTLSDMEHVQVFVRVRP